MPWETINYILQVTWIQEFPLLYPFVIYKILQLHRVWKKDDTLFLPLNGGIFYYRIARKKVCRWKNFENWSKFDKDRCKIIMTPVFLRHGVQWYFTAVIKYQQQTLQMISLINNSSIFTANQGPFRYQALPTLGTFFTNNHLWCF